MDDPFALLDPFAAQLFLRRLPGGSRRRGEASFRAGQVHDLVPENPGISYSAKVLNGGCRNVHLHFDSHDGWEGECSCSQGWQCEHVYAAMSALLAEHRTATVRNLTSTASGTRNTPSVLRPGTDAWPGNELGRRLNAALGRLLTREEKKFLNEVHKAFQRCQDRRSITTGDFQQMGLGWSGYPWEEVNIWPAFPAGEHEFWLYVANAARERNISTPEFMASITDLGPIQERLRRWRRSQEIESWIKKLNDADLPDALLKTDLETTDLRMVVTENEFLLQRKQPGGDEFRTLKSTQLREFANRHDSGRVQLTDEAELLWQIFDQLHEQGALKYFEALDPPGQQLINRLFRSQQLQSRIVNRNGEALARTGERLRWMIEPPAAETEDYCLRLVRADGTALPGIVCILPGCPALYITEHAVFEGPPESSILDPLEENRIPAPALEQPGGVALLQSLEVELPTRIQERLQPVSYQIAIRCELKRPYPESNMEECLVQVQAEASDGRRRSWDGYHWKDPHPASGRQSVKTAQLIPFYDEKPLMQIPALLQPLELKSSQYSEKLVMRVNKKFPELFSAWIKTVPPHIQLHLAGELASFANPNVVGQVRLEVTEAEIDWFDLRVVLNVSDTTLSPEEIKLLLNARGRYVRLAGKGWRRLEYALTPEQDDRLAGLGLNARAFSAEPTRLHALQLADESAKAFLADQQVRQIQRRAGEIKARVTPELPQGVTAQLRPYQLSGFHFLAYLATNRFGGILADDMGLGKTLQTLAWLLWLRAQPRASQSVTGDSPPRADAGLPSLVVCPKSVMDNWHAEAARFTPGLRVKIWAASELPTLGQRLAEAELHVLNYNQLRSIGEILAAARWLAVILDEGQYIKNPNSQTAQIARSLRSEHRLVLSGTPIENRLLDLWSLMTFAMPGVLGSRAEFGRIHDAKGDPFARRRLSARVRPFLLRRTKSQVARDLPDRTEEDLVCEIEGEQQTLYRAELKRAQQLLLRIQTQKELAQQQFHFLTALLRLRQICCDPRLVKDDASAGAKTEALLELLEPLMEEGQKVLVFSQFVEMLRLLQPVLSSRGWPLFYLAGETENRGELIERFQTSEGPGVFLISLKAGGFGLNLTAASYVVLFDPWWNPAVENQAIDRTHRIGQVNKVIAYRLLIKSSIEEKIRELQKQKRSLAEDVLGEEKFAQNLTLDDLHFLLAD